ncbi:MAG: hypothetical protein R2784_05845 [Saprospiraceae bacterium]
MTCSITVNQQISAPGANDGQLTASGNGGTPGYTFMWSNGANTATISNLGPGTYTVTVTDSNGCQSVCTEELQEPSNITKLGDYVWEDIDHDGIQDSNEPWY